MGEAIPLITLGVSAASVAVNAIQTADAQGEQQKQLAAQQTAMNNELAAQQAQETQLQNEQQSANTRDAQLSEVQQKEAGGFMATYNGNASGPSLSGMPGIQASSKAGSSLFGL